MPDRRPATEGELSTFEAAELKGLALTNKTTTGKPLTTSEVKETGNEEKALLIDPGSFDDSAIINANAPGAPGGSASSAPT